MGHFFFAFYFVRSGAGELEVHLIDKLGHDDLSFGCDWRTSITPAI